MEGRKQRRVRVAKAKFRARQHVRISKEKMKFAKGAEQNFSTEIFRISKIDKILDKRIRRGSLEYLVRWRGYSKDFDSWIPASGVKDVR